MALSTSSVFHYTNNISSLYKILESSCFLPSYCKEKSSIDRNSSVWIPMVSFCDIPLTQTTGITGYGKFAIGLKMDWAKKKRLNPVFYLPEDSIVFERNLELLKLVNSYEKSAPLRSVVNNLNENGQFIYLLANIFSPEVAQFNSSIKGLPKEIIEPVQNVYLSIFQNIKEYEGTLKRGKAETPNYRFYNEREWRYIPNISKVDRASFPAMIKEHEWLFKYNKRFTVKPHFKDSNPMKLTFNLSDIDYIIVDTEKRISSLTSKLKKILPIGYEKLLTKVLSFEKIRKDF